MMKSIYILIVTAAMMIAYASCTPDREEYDLHLPADPQNLVVSKGDTSVFLRWDAVPGAHSYLIVRGKQTIVEDLSEPSYEDPFGPDTLVEYRVYAVNETKWRSYRYASDSGFAAIPAGLLPRPPFIEASRNNYKNCTITWTGGRFALSFNVYRDGVLIAEQVVGNSYVDKEAPTTPSEYRVFSVNDAGVSTGYSAATGMKDFFFNGTFEDDEEGFEYTGYTFREPTVAYYAEGSVKVVAAGSGKALQVTGGKVQMLCDWGGVPEKGTYRLKVMLKKSDGGFWMVPNFGDAQHVDATGDWTTFEIETPVLEKGATFNLKIEPHGDDAALIDNWSIEYIDTP